MIGALALASLLAAGLTLGSRLERLAPIDRLLVGAAVGLALLLWLPLAFAVALGTDRGVVVAAVAALAIAASGVRRVRADALAVRDAIGADRGARAVTVSLALIAFLLAYLFHTHILRERDGALYSAGVAWTDLTMHSAFTLSFVERDNLRPPEYPTFAGWPLAYPFLPDFLPAWLVRSGWSLRAAFAVPSWLASVILVALAWRVLRAWTGSRRAAAFALAVFLLPGGLGFVPVLRTLVERGLSGLALNATLMNNLAEDWHSVNYGNLVGNLLIATRGASAGMAIGMAALLLLAERDARRWLAAGTLVGALPLVHTHTFLVLGLVAAFAVATALGSDRRAALAFIAPCAFVALPQAWWIWSRHVAHSTGFVRRWAAFPQECPDPVSFASYWINNTGVLLLVLPLAYAAADRSLRRSTVALLAVFPIANAFVFTPGPHDNAKLFAWFQLGAAALVGAFLARLAAAPRTRVTAFGLAGFLCLSGALALAYEAHDDARIFSREDVELARAVHDATDADAILVTSQALHHPVPALSGRRVLMGPMLVVKMHGIPFEERQREIAAIYRGDPTALAALDRLDDVWILVGPYERRQRLDLDEAAIGARAKARVVVGEKTTLYRVR